MLERTKGVVLHLIRYDDSSIIADIYTLSHGKLSFLVKVPRSRKSNVRTMLLRPLNILELDFDYRQNKDLQRIKEMHVAIPYSSLPYHPVKETLALFLSEFLYHAIKHEVANPSLFEYMCSGLEWLDQTDRGISNFHLVFLIRMTRFLGFWPNVPEVMPGQVFDLKDGVLTNHLPSHGAYIEKEETRWLPYLLRMDFVSMHLFRFTRQQRGRILDVLTDYYRWHVPEFPELKSMQVLREVFS